VARGPHAGLDLPRRFGHPGFRRSEQLAGLLPEELWTGYGFTNVAYKENTDGNTSPQAYFNNVVQSQVATAKALEGAVSPSQRIYHVSLLTNYVFDSGRLKGFSVGAANAGNRRRRSATMARWATRSIRPPSSILPTSTVPVYGDNGNSYTDLWIAYTGGSSATRSS